MACCDLIIYVLHTFKSFVGEEKSVSLPQVVELLADDAAESFSKESTIHKVLTKTGREQVSITYCFRILTEMSVTLLL